MSAITQTLVTGLLSVMLMACSDHTSLNVDNQQGSLGDTTSEKADISGVVLDVQGQPVANAIVVTTPYGRVALTAPDKRRIIETFITDAQGKYTIPAQPFGSYTLKALASGFQPGLRSIGNVDFLPQNLHDGVIQKNFTLANNVDQGDGASPAVALFDNEDKKRMTEFLTVKGIRYDSIRGNVDALSHATYKIFIIGMDATVYEDFADLIAHQALIKQFIDDGGHVMLGQTNDFSIENTNMPIFTDDRQFQLHVENAPFNDFQTALIKDAAHPLVQGMTFMGWNFTEPGQTQLKQNLVFDAAIKASFQGGNWNIVATTPASDFTGATGTVPAESDVVIAEYTDPVSGGHILVNQAAFYQASFGDIVDGNAIILAENVAKYIKQLNGGP